MYQGYENYPTFTVALWFDNDRERKTGWIDRGSGTWCDTSGQGWTDLNGIPQKYPHRKHRPGSVFILPPGARRL